MAFTAERPPAQGQYLVLKVVPLTGAAFSGFTMDQLFCAFLFSHPLLVCSTLDMLDTVQKVLGAVYRRLGHDAVLVVARFVTA